MKGWDVLKKKGSEIVRADECREVFGFPAPHLIGSVCVGECRQCGLDGATLFDSHGEELPDTPLLILAEATEEDWKRAIRADGGFVEDTDRMPYSYFVSTD